MDRLPRICTGCGHEGTAREKLSTLGYPKREAQGPRLFNDRGFLGISDLDFPVW